MRHLSVVLFSFFLLLCVSYAVSNTDVISNSSMLSAIGVSAYFFIIATDSQELAAGAPGHRLDTQRPLIGTVG